MADESINIYRNLPLTLAEKVQAYAQQTARTALRICKRHAVPVRTYEAFAADAIDIMRGCYIGLRASVEQMQQITDAVPLRAWDATENIALCFMARYYSSIAEHASGDTPVLGNDFINAVVRCEAERRANGGMRPVDDEHFKEAQRLYYTYAVLIAAERCDATEDELRGIVPNGIELPEAAKENAIATGLRFQQQREQIKQKPEKEKKKKTLPNNMKPETKVKQYQNCAYVIGNGLQTADNIAGGGTRGKMQPLWKQIERQKQAALALMENSAASDEQKKKAAQLVTDTYAVTQVMDALQVLPQILPPDSGTTDYVTYDMGVYEYARYVTCIERPAKKQMLAVLRATAFISTQRTEIEEIVPKKITTYDEDGNKKRATIEKRIVTNFQPAVVSFRTEYEDNVLVTTATRIRLQIHRFFADGRTAAYIENGKTREYIQPPIQQYLTLGQYYDFTTESERIFRNIILSKPRQAEAKLLAAVFNYEQRQEQQNAKAEDARRTAEQTRAAAEEIQRNPTATPEQKQTAQTQAEEAKDAANRATEQAKYYIKKHKGEDLMRIKAMFEKALQNGLIKSYYSTRGRNGVVWHWLRVDEEARKKRRGR